MEEEEELSVAIVQVEIVTPAQHQHVCWGRCSTCKLAHSAREAADNAARAAARIVPIMVHSNPIGKQMSGSGARVDADVLK